MGQEDLKSLNGSMPKFVPPAKSERETPPPPSNDSGIPVIFLNQSSGKKIAKDKIKPRLVKKRLAKEKIKLLLIKVILGIMYLKT